MKEIVTKIFAALLVVWYLVGIIGFDVHTCSGSGRSFVVAFFEEMTCEEIHPEHSCDPAACCADEHENPAVQMIISLLRLQGPFLMTTIAIMKNAHAAIAHAWTFMPVRSVTSMKQV